MTNPFAASIYVYIVVMTLVFVANSMVAVKILLEYYFMSEDERLFIVGDLSYMNMLYTIAFNTLFWPISCYLVFVNLQAQKASAFDQLLATLRSSRQGQESSAAPETNQLSMLEIIKLFLPPEGTEEPQTFIMGTDDALKLTKEEAEEIQGYIDANRITITRWEELMTEWEKKHGQSSESEDAPAVHEE